MISKASVAVRLSDDALRLEACLNAEAIQLPAA
jgi:hypothetical protein